MSFFSTITDLIYLTLNSFLKSKISSPASSQSMEPILYANFIARQAKFENLPFTQCLIRNEEMDNSLMIDDCKPIYIKEITRDFIRLSWVPDIPELFAPTEHLQKWALMVADLPIEPPDPGINGFNYQKIVLIIGGDKRNKTLYYKARPELHEDIQNWKNCRIILYNPFISCEFKPEPLITLPPLNQRPTWCRTYISPAAIFQRRDGQYILLVNGESRQTKEELPHQKVGAFISAHPWNQAFKPVNATSISTMDPIFQGSATNDSGDSFQITSLIKSQDDGYWIGYGNGRNGDRWNVVAVKFDENFQNIQYFNKIIFPAILNNKSGEYFPTVIRYDNQYRLMWVNRVECESTSWFLSEGISDNELGPFDPEPVDSNPVLLPVQKHDGSFRSNHTHCLSYFLWQGELFCIIDGTSRWKTAGNRANRLFGIIKYDPFNHIWQEDLRNPLFINPMYGDQAWGEQWHWCVDHLGGKQFFLRMENGELLFFFSASNGFDTYQIALAKMKKILV
jgi:hypothetical protein